jgi:two-component system nitrate/nitrite sensor histidine kinase NarX
VDEKTAHLEIERARLAALYDVSAFVAHAAHLDALAQGFVARIRRIARADAVALRWSDDLGQRSLLLAQEGLSPAFASDEQCIARGDCLCGQVPASAQARVIPIGTSGSALGHCGRAGFGTLVSVPVASHQRALGEIDLFYRGATPLGEDEHALLETLASHLAGGMESLRAAAAEKEAAVAGERTLLAQELHDSIAQSLAFLKIQVSLLKGALGRADAPGAERTLAEIDTGVRECYSDVRELLLHFRTPTAAGDIGQALRTTLQKFEHQSGVPAELQVDGHGVPLAADLQVQVLHMVQEALSNVRKHAGARHVRVHVVEAPQWRFEIADDGRGFDPAADAGASHVGLRIMRERAARAGLDVAVASQPGRGTRVTITVPRPAHEEESIDELADPVAGR